MKLGMIVSFAVLASTVSFAATDQQVRSSDDHIRAPIGKKLPRIPAPELPLALVPGEFPQNIDHFGQLSGQTFNQRYWVDSEYASQTDDAPVLYHICGEGDATQGYFLKDNAIAWAQTLGAHIVYLKHRYYGEVCHSRIFHRIT